MPPLRESSPPAATRLQVLCSCPAATEHPLILVLSLGPSAGPVCTLTSCTLMINAARPAYRISCAHSRPIRLFIHVAYNIQRCSAAALQPRFLPPRRLPAPPRRRRPRDSFRSPGNTVARHDTLISAHLRHAPSITTLAPSLHPLQLDCLYKEADLREFYISAHCPLHTRGWACDDTKELHLSVLQGQAAVLPIRS